MEFLRRNLLPHIQKKLLFLPTHSLYELQGRVYQVEELAQQQSEVQPIRRYLPRVNEISTHSTMTTEFVIESSYTNNFQCPPPPLGAVNAGSYPFAGQMLLLEPIDQSVDQRGMICAVDRNQFAVCWNCDEIGHTFMDCAARRIIFCYGCGAKKCGQAAMSEV